MSIAYLNGVFLALDEPALPIEERGHQFGDGVYEVIRIYGGKPFMLDEHLDRLYRSAEAIRLQLDSDRAFFQTIIHQLIDRSGLADLDIYLQVTRGIAPRNHTFPNCPVSISMTAKPSRATPVELKENGAAVWMHPDERWLNCHIKSLNLLPNILAKQVAADNDCLEAVLVRDGYVTEGSSSNIYIVEKGAIRTAPLTNQILAGITRIAVKRIAQELDIPFHEQPFTPEELRNADEAFLTSTTLEVMPVVRYHDDTVIGSGKPGTITQALSERLSALTL
ncbi:D-amino-acid transaminase [Cohnella abietis]|uniref:D-alanine aminotransferase n=1 Tax=Cohnella abietis TaxID=2507935 RepID=A0A3T1CZR8_9BACL|nr:D-amino-acid transaminase [Cohnella abietis]BBI31336.1 D-alanine aminotransferase [Cohnella abietis]